MNDLIVSTSNNPDFDPIIKAVVKSVKSRHTKLIYERALLHFQSWYRRSNYPGLTWSTLQDYVSYMQDGPDHMPDSSINQRMSAVRTMLKLAHKAGAIDDAAYASALLVEGISRDGTRAGNWLTLEEAQELINAPDVSRPKGLRDRAILAIMIGCGLRRDECANLDDTHVKLRDGRWVIVDLIGKGNKFRTVPIPDFAEQALHDWVNSFPEITFYYFRPLNKKGNFIGEKISAQTIYDLIKYYSKKTGLEIAPHDLRRTFAKLPRKGGAQLEQIQLSLGHKSIRTTQRYLGTEQDLVNAPGDVIDIKIK